MKKRGFLAAPQPLAARVALGRWIWLWVALLFIAGCAAGDRRFDASPAGFWAGLWHGLILIVTFVISLFSDTVRIYEANNAGGGYDFGFVLGVVIATGGCRATCRKKRRERDLRDLRASEWAEIGRRVEEKVKRAVHSAVSEGDERDKEWNEIGRKIEEKIKRELRDWAEN